MKRVCDYGVWDAAQGAAAQLGSFPSKLETILALRFACYGDADGRRDDSGARDDDRSAASLAVRPGPVL